MYESKKIYLLFLNIFNLYKMMDEISKMGNINSVGDFLDFKLSIKTVIIILFLYCVCVFIFIVFMFGGINNTIDYASNIIESTKKSIIIHKDKLTNTEDKHFPINETSHIKDD